MLRIGIDIGKALGALDGICRYSRGLLAGLAELEAALPAAERFEYRLYPLLVCDRVIAPEELLPAGAAGFELAAGRAPGRGEVDLFHATAWAVPAAYRGPLALTLYDLTFLTLPETHTKENRAHCAVGLARALARGAALSVLSQHGRDEARTRLGVPDERLAVAPPGLDARFTPQDDAAVARARADLGVEGAYVLGVGTFEPRKNLDGLVEAWRRLPSAIRERFTLVLAGGEGWGEAGGGGSPGGELEARGARVQRLGRVEDAVLPALYAGASVFVYPSLGEGFGLPPLEAMACGAPVVASDRPALPETVDGAAELCDPTAPDALAAAIARVLDDPARAATLRVAGLERARRNSRRATAEAVRAQWAALRTTWPGAGG